MSAEHFYETTGDSAEQVKQQARPNGVDAPYLSEQWLALTFVAAQADRLRYTALWNQWHLWEATHWSRDEKLRAFSLAAEHCRMIANNLNKPSRDIAKAKVRAAVVSLARENPKFAMASDDWDASDWNFNTGGDE